MPDTIRLQIPGDKYFRTDQASGRSAGTMYPSRSPLTHRRDVDKGVRGFDFDGRGGGSEPTSPDRRERAGTPNNCRGSRDLRSRRLVPTSGASLPAQPLGRNRGAIQSGSPPGHARGPGGTPHSGWGRRRPPVSGGDPRPSSPAALGEAPTRSRKTRVRLPPPPPFAQVRAYFYSHQIRCGTPQRVAGQGEARSSRPSVHVLYTLSV